MLKVKVQQSEISSSWKTYSGFDYESCDIIRFCCTADVSQSGRNGILQATSVSKLQVEGAGSFWKCHIKRSSQSPNVFMCLNEEEPRLLEIGSNN